MSNRPKLKNKRCPDCNASIRTRQYGSTEAVTGFMTVHACTCPLRQQIDALARDDLHHVAGPALQLGRRVLAYRLLEPAEIELFKLHKPGEDTADWVVVAEFAPGGYEDPSDEVVGRAVVNFPEGVFAWMMAPRHVADLMGRLHVGEFADE